MVGMPEPDGTIAERFAAMGWPHPLREQQREALTALDAATGEDLTHRSHEPLDLTTALRVAWE